MYPLSKITMRGDFACVEKSRIVMPVKKAVPGSSRSSAEKDAVAIEDEMNSCSGNLAVPDELPEEEEANGLKTYGCYYVPAVNGRYLEVVPSERGFFN